MLRDRKQAERVNDYVNTDIGTLYPSTNSRSLLRYEAQHVRECLLQDLKESPVMTHEDTLILAETTESIRKQAGCVYDQD